MWQKRRRKGYSDDFMWVLAIALILLVAVGIFSYFVPYTGPLTNITIHQFSPGQVGFVDDIASRTINLRTFSVGMEQEQVLRSFPKFDITQGYFGGNTESWDIIVPQYLLDTSRGVAISFIVADTNNYGNLIIKWNGREIINKPLKEGTHDLYIDRNFVREQNTFEVSATGPGIFFWANTVYVLKNINVNLLYGPDRIIPFEVLSSEMAKFDRAEITSDVTGNGNMEIQINGVPVFTGNPQGDFKESFTLFEAPIKVGQNILTFKSREGSYLLEGTLFKIYVHGDQSVAASRLNMTEEHFNWLAGSVFQGRINYFIQNIARQGSVEILVNNRQVNTPVPRAGWNSAFYTADMVDVGENTIAVGGTGSFNIPDMMVGLER